MSFYGVGNEMTHART